MYIFVYITVIQKHFMTVLSLIKHLCYFTVRCDLKLLESILSNVLYKAAREKASFSISLQSAFEPAILTFFMYKYNVTFFKFKFCFTLRRIGYHNSVPVWQKGEKNQNLVALFFKQCL